MVHGVKNDTYTINYMDGKERKSIQVQNGIKIQADYISNKTKIGNFLLKFKTPGTTTLPQLSQTEIAMLKTFEMADKEEGLTQADITKLYEIAKDGRLTQYFNARTPGNAHAEKENQTTPIGPNKIAINVNDNKAKKIFGLMVSFSSKKPAKS